MSCRGRICERVDVANDGVRFWFDPVACWLTAMAARGLAAEQRNRTCGGAPLAGTMAAGDPCPVWRMNAPWT